MRDYSKRQKVKAFEVGEITCNPPGPHSHFGTITVKPKDQSHGDDVVIDGGWSMSELMNIQSELSLTGCYLTQEYNSKVYTFMGKSDFEMQYELERPTAMAQQDHEMERVLTEKGLTAPRVTVDEIDQDINNLKVHCYVVPGTTTTIATAIMQDGFTVATDYSASASVENFDPDIGIEIATNNVLEKARSELWRLRGFALKQKISKGQLTDLGGVAP